MWKGARVRGRCHPYKRRPETPLRRRGTARSCRWTPLSPRERLNLMPSRRLSGERGRDARRKAHLLGAPAEGLRAVSGVSEATCDSLAWWDAVWQERDAHHRNWNGVTYVGAYRPLAPGQRSLVIPITPLWQVFPPGTPGTTRLHPCLSSLLIIWVYLDPN